MLKTSLKPQIKFYFRVAYKRECEFYRSWWGQSSINSTKMFIKNARNTRKKRIKRYMLKLVWKGWYVS
jgi:hypothetical protein